MKSPRQTESFLKNRFQQAGIRPNTRHGQSFLVDLNLVELLARTAEVTSDDVVLEIGTGTGSLTAILARQAAVVVTVELDAQLHQLAAEALIDFDNVVMLRQDALKNKNRFRPEVLRALNEHLEAGHGRRLKLAANLPYCVATPILSNLLSVEPVPVSMTVTIQKELADRIMARPRTKDYGALSIWIQSQCDIQLIRVLPPNVFWPRPKVESAIIQIVPNTERRGRIPDLSFFHSFVRAMFFHRRKLLRSELLSAFKGDLDKPAVDRILDQHDLSPTCRSEELDVETMFALSESVRACLR
jgi:16S rRNA (adenine1518-N6/adenine1519-N6)-dimethyltransferase